MKRKLCYGYQVILLIFYFTEMDSYYYCCFKVRFYIAGSHKQARIQDFPWVGKGERSEPHPASGGPGAEPPFGGGGGVKALLIFEKYSLRM